MKKLSNRSGVVRFSEPLIQQDSLTKTFGECRSRPQGRLSSRDRATRPAWNIAQLQACPIVRRQTSLAGNRNDAALSKLR
jgi:hypothetical protein